MLSLGVYCTSWTFFGSVGIASSHGIEFLAIYIGPIIVFSLLHPFLLRIVRLAKAQNITSIADFVAARYGKSGSVAALVAVAHRRRRRPLHCAAAQGDFGIADDRSHRE